MSRLTEEALPPDNFISAQRFESACGSHRVNLPTHQAPSGLPACPPGHAKYWSKHCRAYNACDERVYFVQDSWYEREYVPLYQKQHRGKHDGHPGKDHGHEHNH